MRKILQIERKKNCKVKTKVIALNQFPSIFLNFFSNKSVGINIVNIRVELIIFFLHNKKSVFRSGYL